MAATTTRCYDDGDYNNHGHSTTTMTMMATTMMTENGTIVDAAVAMTQLQR